MKGLKLKALVNSDNQIFVTPPELLRSERELDTSNLKNCTFSTVDQLKDLIKGKRVTRQFVVKNKQEDYEQVQKLNE